MKDRGEVIEQARPAHTLGQIEKRIGDMMIRQELARRKRQVRPLPDKWAEKSPRFKRRAD